MSVQQEGIDIVVREDGSQVVQRNLEAIGTSAGKSQDVVDELRQAVKDLSGAAGELKAAVTTMNELQQAAASTASAQTALSTSTSNLSKTVQTTSTTVANLTSTVTDQKAALAGASSTVENYNSHVNDFRNAQVEAEQTASDLQSRIAKLTASVTPLSTVLDTANKQLVEAKALYEQGAIGANDYAIAEATLTQRIKVTTLAIQEEQKELMHHNATANLSRMQLMELSHVFESLFSAVAAGISPMKALTLESGRIAQVASMSEGGLGGLLGSLGVMLAPLVPVILAIAAAVGVLGAAFLLLKANAENAQLDRNITAKLDSLSVGADYTAVAVRGAVEEIRNLGVSSKDASAAVNTFLADGVAQARLTQFGTAAKDLSAIMGTSLPQAATQVSKAFTGNWDDVKKLDEQLNFLTLDEAKHIKSLYDSKNAAEARSEAFNIFTTKYAKAYNDSLSDMQKLEIAAGNAWHSFMDSLSNSAPMQAVAGFIDVLVQRLTTLLNRITDARHLSGQALDQQMSESSITTTADYKRLYEAKKALADFDLAHPGSSDRSRAPLVQAVAATQGQFNVDNKRYTELSDQRQKLQTDAAITGDTIVPGQGAKNQLETTKPKAEKKESFDKAKELKDVNDKLTDEFNRTGMLQEQQQVQQKLDAITEKFAEHKKPLDEAEIANLKAKIQSIQDATRVQAQMNTIYNEFNQSAQTYNDQLAASKKLLDEGKISQNQYAYAVEQAQSAYDSSKDLIGANNYLRTYNDTVAKVTLSLQNQAISQTQANQAMQDAIKARDMSAGGNTVAASNLQGIISSVTSDSDYLKSVKAQYDAIDKMRHDDVLSERQAQQAKAMVAAKTQSVQLTDATNFFGDMAILAKSKNKELAAIGKAAAIVNATIQTYQAATAAYASLAGIPIIGPALGAAAAAAAVVMGLENISQIKSAGFMDGGFTGNGSRTDIAGHVHGQEFVVNSEATSRYRGLLEAMNDGRPISLPSPGSSRSGTTTSGSRGSPVTVIIENHGTPQSYDVMDWDETSIRLLAKDEADRSVSKNAGRVVAGQMANPNSEISTAVQTHTSATRKR